VVIPTRGRVRQLKDCLRAVASSDYPATRLEVIVVDDDAQPTRTALTAVRNGLEVTVLESARRGPAAARNAGARHARGDVLVFTDDDCRVDPGWLSALASSVAEGPAEGAGGHTVNELTDNHWSKVSQTIIDLVYAYQNGDAAHARFVATNNLAVRTEAFRQVGGFDQSLRTAEDRDFCRRWRAAGLELTYAPDAVVRHAHELDLPAFVRQHFAYGRGAFRFHRRAWAAGDAQVAATARFYASLPQLVREVAGQNGGLASPVGVAVDIAVWQAVNAAGFAWEAARTLVRPRA
jgi:GT2 family glycosyltransferase